MNQANAQVDENTDQVKRRKSAQKVTASIAQKGAFMLAAAAAGQFHTKSEADRKKAVKSFHSEVAKVLRNALKEKVSIKQLSKIRLTVEENRITLKAYVNNEAGKRTVNAIISVRPISVKKQVNANT